MKSTSIFHDLLSSSYYPLTYETRTNYTLSSRIPYSVFSVDDILQPQECQSIINTCESIGFQNLDDIFPQDYRRSSRVMIFSQKLARILYDRIIPSFLPQDLHVVPIGFARSGKWVPVRLNECLKVIRYNPGGAIIPHRDGPWVPFEDQASIYTIVFYLNEDFKGGETVMHYSGETGPRDHYLEGKSHYVTPKVGRMAVFDHRVYHSSNTVRDSIKYILRAELIFQQVYSPEALMSSVKTSNYNYMYSQNYQEARRLYDISRAAEQSGKKEEFISTYEEVLQLQIFASADEDLKSKDSCPHLEREIAWKLLIHFLTLPEISQLALVSRGLSHLVRLNEVWRGLYIARWGDGLLPNSKSGPAKRHLNEFVIDWRSLYQLRIHFMGSFSSTLVYLGVNSILYGCKPPLVKTWFKQWRRQADFQEMNFAFESDHEITIGRLRSVFYDIMLTQILGYSYPYHINMPDYFRFVPFHDLLTNVHPTALPPTRQLSSEIRMELENETFPRNGRSLIFDNGEPVNWSVCAALIRLAIGIQSTSPILLIVNPPDFPCIPAVVTSPPASSLSLQDIDALHSLHKIKETFEEVILAFSTVLSTPAMRIEHVGVAALASLGLTSGVSIWVSLDTVYISSIRLSIVRDNQCLTSNASCIPEECLRIASSWKSAGHWDMNIEDLTTMEVNQISNSVPIVLIQPRDDIVPAAKYQEVRSYFQAHEHISDSSHRDVDTPLILRPTHFRFLGEVDCLGIMKGGYKLSVNYDHRSKCIFHSFL